MTNVSAFFDLNSFGVISGLYVHVKLFLEDSRHAIRTIIFVPIR